ncbi:MAG: hypothetical protein JXB88_06835 [Spirochaetales bacterium]|nr:hypothetical protein [Spirochaetales bacterium]
MMKKKTNAERLAMGCSMFEAAKTIVYSSILEKKPGIAEKDLRVEMFLRFYGLDFNESEKQKIIQHLMTHSS